MQVTRMLLYGQIVHLTSLNTNILITLGNIFKGLKCIQSLKITLKVYKFPNQASSYEINCRRMVYHTLQTLIENLWHALHCNPKFLRSGVVFLL